MNQVFYHCATAPLYVRRNDIHSVPCWDFLAISVVTRSRIFSLYLVVTCRDFLAVSAVTGSRIFRPYQVVTCRDFPYLQLLAAEFSGLICSYLPRFSGLTFSGTRRPGFSGRICCFWPGFSGHSFSGMGNLKILYGQQANCSGINSGIFILNTGIFWREAKTKRLFSQCSMKWNTVKMGWVRRLKFFLQYN